MLARRSRVVNIQFFFSFLLYNTGLLPVRVTISNPFNFQRDVMRRVSVKCNMENNRIKNDKIVSEKDSISKANAFEKYFKYNSACVFRTSI